MRKYVAVAVMAICMMVCGTGAATAQAPGTSTVLLDRQQAAAILPPSVFYRGQSASIQGRNSGGFKLPDGKLVLFTMVDTSGYSTSVKEMYQAYLLTEVPLTIGGQSLQPGAYGFGFIAGDKMVVMDIGNNQLLSVPTTQDPNLKRPTPLQVLADASNGAYRLYLGRSYVTVAPTVK